MCYEYLDHTADVQLHSWGASLEEAFGQQVIAMMALITELETVDLAPPALAEVVEVVSTGHNLHSLLYNFLDEWLYKFNAELFVCRRISVGSIDRRNWRVVSRGVGAHFRLGQHPQVKVRVRVRANPN